MRNKNTMIGCMNGKIKQDDCGETEPSLCESMYGFTIISVSDIVVNFCDNCPYPIVDSGRAAWQD